MPQDKNLTVMTNCRCQTQGDSSAALKLIQGIVRSNRGGQQKINVTWILSAQGKFADLPFYISYIQLAQQIGVQVIFTDPEMSDVSNRVISNTDFFLYFPYNFNINGRSIFY